MNSRSSWTNLEAESSPDIIYYSLVRNKHLIKCFIDAFQVVQNISGNFNKKELRETEQKKVIKVKNRSLKAYILKSDHGAESTPV